MEASAASVQSIKKIIKEGEAEIGITTHNVFYNPVQEFSRDLSIAVLNTFIDDYKTEKFAKLARKSKNEDCSKVDVTILDALSSTGIRSIRYAKEVPCVTKIIANDISEEAAETIKSNVIHNQVENKVETSHNDACTLMDMHKDPLKRFTAIDIDPYGCPSKFFYSAVQSVQDGGLLLVTATDMIVLAGRHKGDCYKRYGAVSLNTGCYREMALRILLQRIETFANLHNRYIVPLLSVSTDFYLRVFVKVYTGGRESKESVSKMSMVYNCVGCDTITLQPLGELKPSTKNSIPVIHSPNAKPLGINCIHCNHHTHYVGGPIWSAPIHNLSFVYRLLVYVQSSSSLFGTAKRMEGILSMIIEELQNVPLYYTMLKLFGKITSKMMPMKTMRSAILNAGYEVSYSHTATGSVKTDAPAQLIWDIVRTWAKTNPPKPARLEANPIVKYILSQEIQNTIDLCEAEEAEPHSRKSRLMRFQPNPKPYWGPGFRNAINVDAGEMAKAKHDRKKDAQRQKTTKREHISQNDEESHKKSKSDTPNI